MDREQAGDESAELYTALSLRHPLIYIMIPKPKRDEVLALWAYDAALTQVMQGVKEPSLQVMRLIWWRDRILAMRREGVPAHPVLQGLSRIDSQSLLEQAAALADHWADFVETDALDEAAVEQLATARGNILYGGTAALLGMTFDGARLRDPGRYWALVDIASHISDAVLREKLWAAARQAGKPWRGLPKPLGALTKLAGLRAAHGGIKPLAEQAMLLRFAIFGR